MARKAVTRGSETRHLGGLKRILLGWMLLAAWIAGSSAAVFETEAFADAAQAKRYHALINELRCLVCQNQSIADSNADLAADLRREVRRMMNTGASDQAIVDYLVERYGDFVLYRPPLKPTTVLLWVGPFLLCLAALALLRSRVRRQTAPVALSEGERARAEQLLERRSKPDEPPSDTA